ncbi:MAG: flagellar motor switch protein FliM [Bacillota bacterium]|nr:flagellar motor switch protein FliM [Bacillota bacterium]
MADKMSQNEIDELLSALSSGEVDVKEIEEEQNKKKVKKYDFRRPEKFSKEQLRSIEVIHENFSRLAANFLSGYLRSAVEIKVISIESMVFSEFNNSISNPAVIGMVDFSPLDGHVLIEVGSNITFVMIDRLLGGMGKNSVPKEPRIITEIEEVLVRGILNKMVTLMKDSWSAIIELEPSLGNIETNSQFAQVFSPSESIALITCNIQVDENEGLMNIAIPFIVIEPILSNLSSKFWFSSSKKKEQSESEYNALEEKIEETEVEIKTVLGTTGLTVGELLTLGVGDIIVLDAEVTRELSVFVGGKLKYFGIPGSSKKRMAVKITEINDDKGGGK